MNLAVLFAQADFALSGRQRSFAARRLQNSRFLLWQKALEQLRRPRPTGLGFLAAQAALAKIDIRSPTGIFIPCALIVFINKGDFLCLQTYLLQL